MHAHQKYGNCRWTGQKTTGQAEQYGLPVAGPAAVYELQAQVKAIADCVESDRGSLSLCLCLVGIDDSQSGTQRLSEIMRCLDEQEATQ